MTNKRIINQGEGLAESMSQLSVGELAMSEGRDEGLVEERPESADSLGPPSPAVDTTGLNATLVAPNIIVSDRATAENEDALLRMGVTHIVTVDVIRLREELYSEPARFKFHFVEATDTVDQDLLTQLPKVFEFLEDAVRILFHCQQGISRSVAVCIAYLMYKTKKSLEDICEQVCTARSAAEPNDGFTNQLLLFERMGNVINPSDLGFQMYAMNVCLKRLLASRDVQSLNTPERQNFYQYLPPAEPDIRCRQCRYLISSSGRVIPHNAGQNIRWSAGLVFDEEGEQVHGLREVGRHQGGSHIFNRSTGHFWKVKNRLSRALRESKGNPPMVPEPGRCRKGIFIIPDDQILRRIYRSYGPIRCANCATILGRYSWIHPVRCMCLAETRFGFLLLAHHITMPPGYFSNLDEQLAACGLAGIRSYRRSSS